MPIEPLLRRGLAVAIAVAASAGIVSAGVVANPERSDVALARAEVVHSPDAQRPVSLLAVEPEAVPLGTEVAAAPGPSPEPAAAPAPAAPTSPEGPEPEPAGSPAPPAPAPASAPAPAPTPAAAPAPAQPAPAESTAAHVGTRDRDCESSMLRWMNESRAAAGRPVLAWDDAILHVAVDWSHHMAAEDDLAHNPRYGDQVFAARAEAVTAAENVGWGNDSARGVYEEFLRSPTHKDKILSTALSHAAVGCVRDGAGEVWVTVDFWG